MTPDQMRDLQPGDALQHKQTGAMRIVLQVRSTTVDVAAVEYLEERDADEWVKINWPV